MPFFLAIGMFVAICPLAILGKISPLSILKILCVFAVVILFFVIINFSPKQGSLLDIIMLKESGVFITRRVLGPSYAISLAFLAVLPISLLRYKGNEANENA